MMLFSSISYDTDILKISVECCRSRACCRFFGSCGDYNYVSGSDFGKGNGFLVRLVKDI